eukprot:353941-Chlamydomonas_euryale.AAC.2
MPHSKPSPPTHPGLSDLLVRRTSQGPSQGTSQGTQIGLCCAAPHCNEIRSTSRQGSGPAVTTAHAYLEHRQRRSHGRHRALQHLVNCVDVCGLREVGTPNEPPLVAAHSYCGELLRQVGGKAGQGGCRLDSRIERPAGRMRPANQRKTSQRRRVRSPPRCCQSAGNRRVPPRRGGERSAAAWCDGRGSASCRRRRHGCRRRACECACTRHTRAHAWIREPPCAWMQIPPHAWKQIQLHAWIPEPPCAWMQIPPHAWKQIPLHAWMPTPPPPCINARAITCMYHRKHGCMCHHIHASIDVRDIS